MVFVLTDLSCFFILRELYRLNVPYGSEYVSGSGDGGAEDSFRESSKSFSFSLSISRRLSFLWGSEDLVGGSVDAKST